MTQFWASYRADIPKKLKLIRRRNQQRAAPTRTFKCPMDQTLITHWSQAPGYEKNKLPLYLKKLQIYYPKDPKALRPLNAYLTSEVFKPPHNKDNAGKLRKLVLNILSRYKKAYLRQLCVGIYDRTIPVEKLAAGATERLIVFPGSNLSERPLLAIKKFLINNKALRHISVFEDPDMFSYISGWIQYMPYLKSIDIVNPTYVSDLQNKRIFQASSAHLQKVALFGLLNDTYNNSPNLLIKLLEMIADIKGLKSFKMDTDCSGKFNIDKIPFDKFEQRNIAYDIRPYKCSTKLTLSKTTISYLENLEVLNLNLREDPNKYDSLSAQASKYGNETQENFQKNLHLNLYERYTLNLTRFLSACKNITVLNLMMPQHSGIELDFGSLQEFNNIRDLYIRLGDTRGNNVNLFQNLSLCFEKNPTLEALSIYTDGNAPEEYVHMIPIFEFCAHTLRRFSINLQDFFRIGDTDECEAINHISQALNKLKDLKSLRIESRCVDEILAQLPTLTGQHSSLEELSMHHVSSRQIQIHLNLKNPSCLKKLNLEIAKLDDIPNLQEVFSELKGLIDLKVKTWDITQDMWQKFRHILKSFHSLERFVLQSNVSYALVNIIKMDLKIIFNSQTSIKYLEFVRPKSYYDKDDITDLIMTRTDLKLKPNKLTRKN